MREITCGSKEIIFRQGDIASVMYDIIGGKVGIFTDYGTDREKLIAELGADQGFGEMGLIECYPRSATAVALEDGTRLTELSAGDISEYFRDKPEKVLRLMRQLSQRIRETTKKYIDVRRTVSDRENCSEADIERRLMIQKEMELYAAQYSSTWM